MVLKLDVAVQTELSECLWSSTNSSATTSRTSSMPGKGFEIVFKFFKIFKLNKYLFRNF